MLHDLDGGHQIVGMEVGIDFGGLPVYMADDGLQGRQVNTGADGPGDEGVAAAIGDHTFPADLGHQLPPIPFGIIGCGFIGAGVAIDQQGATAGAGIGTDPLIGGQAIGADGNDTVAACVGFAATDEMILFAVDQRNTEQLAGAAAAGNQN